jgi:hypothetical protein
MKTLKSLLIGMMFIACSPMMAQVSVNVNIGSPPAWGPAGYTEVRYYYLPDIDTYYDVSTGQYIYVRNGGWVRATTLPVVHRRYNLYSGYKVVLTDYRGATPYVYYKTHKVKYPHGYRPGPQKTVGLPPGQAKKARLVSSPGRGNAVVVHKGKPHKGHGHHKGKGKGKGRD